MGLIWYLFKLILEKIRKKYRSFFSFLRFGGYCSQGSCSETHSPVHWMKNTIQREEINTHCSESTTYITKAINYILEQFIYESGASYFLYFLRFVSHLCLYKINIVHNLKRTFKIL